MKRSFVLPGLLIVSSLAGWAQAKIVSVVNAASGQAGLPNGGALATAYVSGLSGLTPGTYTAPTGRPLPTVLGGVAVTVNYGSAPLVSVTVPPDPSQPVQVTFQVPLERNVSLPFNTVNSPYPVFAGYVAVNGAVLTPTPSPPAWDGFFSDANGFAIALHGSDSSPVTQQNPARPGELIAAYADDFFVTSPPPPIGIAVPPQLLFQIQYGVGHSFGSYLYLQAYVQGGGTCLAPFPSNDCGMGLTSTPALQITYASLAPGQTGMEEIDFVVPANQQPGNWPLFFNEGSCPSGTNCGSGGGFSSPYVLLAVGASNGATPSFLSVSSITDQTTGQWCNLSTDSSCTLNVSQNDILQITGIGFSPEGGNTIYLVAATGTSAGSEWWLYEQDGYLFSDASRTQITAQVACYLPPGGYRFFVKPPSREYQPICPGNYSPHG